MRQEIETRTQWLNERAAASRGLCFVLMVGARGTLKHHVRPRSSEGSQLE